MRIPSANPQAIGCVRGGMGAPKLKGTVRFYAIPGGTDFSDTGGHYNPDARDHPRHAGDLPPLLSMAGRAFLAVETGRFTPCEVVGRTVVIHGSADDFHTQPAGNAGKKIACGVIRRV